MIKNRLLALLVLSLLVGCKKPAAQTSEFQGVIEQDERLIGFEVAGRLKSLSVERGDAIALGAEIGRLDDGLEAPLLDARRADIRLAHAQLALLHAGARREDVRAAQHEVEAANAGIALLNDRLERAATLAGHGAVAPTQEQDLRRDIARATAQRDAANDRVRGLQRGARAQEIEAAEARLDAANAALSALQARLSRYTLSAPMNGRVVDVMIEPGEMVAPGTPVITIADRAHPYIDVFVPQQRLAPLRVGMTARVHVDGEGAAFIGKIEHISNRAEFTPRFLFSPEERSNLVTRVRVRFDDPDDHAHAGVPAFVKFDVATPSAQGDR